MFKDISYFNGDILILTKYHIFSESILILRMSPDVQRKSPDFVRKSPDFNGSLLDFYGSLLIFHESLLFPYENNILFLPNRALPEGARGAPTGGPGTPRIHVYIDPWIPEHAHWAAWLLGKRAKDYKDLIGVRAGRYSGIFTRVCE